MVEPAEPVKAVQTRLPRSRVSALQRDCALAGITVNDWIKSLIEKALPGLRKAAAKRTTRESD